MSKIIKILDIKNEVEALKFKSILDENGIPYNLRSYRDSAYDGIFQVQKGWGVIQSKEEYREKIIELYNEYIIKEKKKFKE
ncbi:MAG: hypothetical protein JXB50_04465 [Spirochaetes bacterium]|nr:hypothetical protein [Spirochaetota bacterium]